MKNHAVVGIKANKKNLKENVSRTPDNQQVVARTRILTPMYQPPNTAKVKARLYIDEQGLYLLEYFGEKYLSSCCDDVDAPDVSNCIPTIYTHNSSQTVNNTDPDLT